MDDDAGDWFADTGDEPAAEESAAPAAAAGADAAPASGGDGAPGDAQAAGAEGGEAPKEEAADEYLDPDKMILFRHWVRPKFLQYKYLYDYRHNYYDDVIDYLDKRQRGYRRDIPVPQTWAERVLRTYTSKINRIEKFRKTIEDTKLVTKTKLSGLFHVYHSKTYINRRCFSIMA